LKIRKLLQRVGAKSKDRTAEVVRQKEEIEIKNKHITDSIKICKRIQNAILPPNDYVKQALPNSFIFYRPKDIVSGDFFWLIKRQTFRSMLLSIALVMVFLVLLCRMLGIIN
jgi:hypothetical protein